MEIMDSNIVFLSVLILLLVLLLGLRNWIFISICAGFLLNYVGYGSIEAFDLGILMTMLAIGMHIDLSILFSKIRTILVLIMSTVAIIAVNTGICKLILKMSLFNSLLVGASLSLSSTIVTYQILKDSNAMSSDYGIDSIFATIIQDIFGIACLLLVENRNFDVILGIKYVFVVLGFILLKAFMNFALPLLYDMGFIKESYGRSSLTIVGLLSVMMFFMSGWLHRFGISKEIIFLVFGVTCKKELIQYDLIINILQKIFLIYIFVSSGYNTDLMSLFSYCKKVFELFIVIHIVKFFINYTLLAFVNKNKFTNLRVAIITASASELTYFIVSLLNVPVAVRSTLNLVTTLSILVTPIVFNRVNRLILSHYKRTFGIAKHAARLYISNLSSYVLVVGINDITRALNDMLGLKAISTVLIDNDIDRILRYQNSNYFYMDGIFSDTYEVLDVKKVLCIVLQAVSAGRLEGILKTIRRHTMLCQIYVLCGRESVDIVLKYEAMPVILTHRTTQEVVGSVVKEITHLLSNNISMI